MVEKIDHLGIAVKSLEESIAFYENVLGIKCQGMEEVVSQKVRTAFFHVGDTHIELLEPTSDDSPIAKFMSKNGEGIHHVAYYTNDIKSQLEQAQKAGAKLIHKTPIDGAGGKKVAFLHPKSTHGVLTEFCSDEK
ncbi:MAG: methylmalonyl-CoA epimerase [Bacteriovoracaceae bacterium]|nr:methylmalonyl-CoA epimerase [Bacteriovoracaceae bacterium]